MNNNWDKYLDPPDEPEAVYCEECGQEKEEIDNFGGQRDLVCVNSFCPINFSGTSREMAYKLVDALDDLDTYKRRCERLKIKYDGLLSDVIEQEEKPQPKQRKS